MKRHELVDFVRNNYQTRNMVVDWFNIVEMGFIVARREDAQEMICFFDCYGDGEIETMHYSDAVSVLTDAGFTPNEILFEFYEKNNLVEVMANDYATSDRDAKFIEFLIMAKNNESEWDWRCEASELHSQVEWMQKKIANLERTNKYFQTKLYEAETKLKKLAGSEEFDIPF